MEGLEPVELLAGAGELDRLAGDRAHRQRRAAAGVAVDPGEDDAGQRHLLGEALGDVDRVLAGQRIDDEQDLVGLGDLGDRLHLVHQRLVDVEPAGGVEQEDVIALQLRRLERAAGDVDRLLAGDDRQASRPRPARRARASCSCAAGRATSSDAIITFLRSFSVRRLAILAVVVVLPEPCRPTIMITAGGVTSRLSSAASAPSISTSASWTILTTCWPGVTDFSTCWPTACSVDLVDELADHRQRDVGLEQGDRAPRASPRARPPRSARRGRAGGRTRRSGDRSGCRTSHSPPARDRKRKNAGGRNLAGQRASSDASSHPSNGCGGA